jgi:hypothetical protein
MVDRGTGDTTLLGVVPTASPQGNRSDPMTSYFFDKQFKWAARLYSSTEKSRLEQDALGFCFVNDMRQGDEVVTNSRMRGLW